MQTMAFDNFTTAWQKYVTAKRIVGRRFDSEVNLLCFVVDVAKEFVEEQNPYTSALSKNERKCVRDFLYSVGRMLRIGDSLIVQKDDYAEASKRLSSSVYMDRRLNAPICAHVIEKVEGICGAVPKVTPHALEVAFREIVSGKQILDESLLEAIAKFMVELDFFVAENARIEVRIPHQKPFNKDTLLVLQEVLGVFHNSHDAESMREKTRIERFLMGVDVKVIWPRNDVVAETGEFLVISIPGEMTAKVIKPCLKYDDIILRGEKIMPA